ncbi:hypothetical protein LZ32DRAFT_116604 [Colletotrichum eremochloae]|nr:hypothetical protein LZ32DRAFT_116604 [Colletotrichum eremochloae]
MILSLSHTDTLSPPLFFFSFFLSTNSCTYIACVNTSKSKTISKSSALVPRGLLLRLTFFFFLHFSPPP